MKNVWEFIKLALALVLLAPLLAWEIMKWPDE